MTSPWLKKLVTKFFLFFILETIVLSKETKMIMNLPGGPGLQSKSRCFKVISYKIKYDERKKNSKEKSDERIGFSDISDSQAVFLKNSDPRRKTV